MAWYETALAAAGGGGLFSALAYAFGKWIDKHRPAHEVQELTEEGLRNQVRFLGEEVDKLQKDVGQLREGLRRQSTSAHNLQMLIRRFVIEHPDSADWWDKELAKLEQ